MDLSQSIELGLAACGAAILGSMLGLGGGVILVPIYTLFFGVDEKIAIGASAIAVVTNSIMGSSVHLRSRFTNLRLATLLLVPTATGSLIGASLAVRAPERFLNALLGGVLTYAAVSMLLRRRAPPPPVTGEPDPLHLGASYHDPAIDRRVEYQPERVRNGLSVSGVAGFVSGMLGIGGGVIQVPAMTLMMRVPVKAAVGTSTLMVGITAVATSFVFFSNEKIDPAVVVPSMVGIVAGAQIGARLTRRLEVQRLVILFVIVLLYLGVRLLLRAADVSLPDWKG